MNYRRKLSMIVAEIETMELEAATAEVPLPQIDADMVPQGEWSWESCRIPADAGNEARASTGRTATPALIAGNRPAA
jgi:hypothetical protein